jgi:hypothetical protein
VNGNLTFYFFGLEIRNIFVHFQYFVFFNLITFLNPAVWSWIGDYWGPEGHS